MSMDPRDPRYSDTPNVDTHPLEGRRPRGPGEPAGAAVNERRGVAYWMWEEEQELDRAIERMTEEIKDLERRIVEARAKRDERRLIQVEMRAARQMIEAAGLRVEQRGTEVHVSVDKGLTDAIAAGVTRDERPPHSALDDTLRARQVRDAARRAGEPER